MSLSDFRNHAVATESGMNVRSARICPEPLTARGRKVCWVLKLASPWHRGAQYSYPRAIIECLIRGCVEVVRSFLGIPS